MKNLFHTDVLAAFRCIRKFLALALLVGTSMAQAQSCGFIGQRTVKSYWFEGNVGMVIVPTQPFDNPAGCTKSDQVFVLVSQPQYKQVVAAVMHSMSTNTPIQGYGCGCHTYWSNQTWPIVNSLGVGGGPL